MSALSGSVNFAALEKTLQVSAAPPMGCSPHNYDDYLKRVATFRMAFLWFERADELSPPQCAQHGWCLVAHETLQCQVPLSGHPFLRALMVGTSDSV
jgi:hypothetical protein